jgi:hypothetical protein
VRLKAKKEKREAERKRREEEKWRLPPLHYAKKDKSRSATTTSSCPTKPAIRTSPSTSRSSSPAKKKHVSWAPSTSTLDGDGNLATEPLEDGHDIDLRTGTPSTWTRLVPLQEVPPAHSIQPHASTSIEERSARGQELIGAMSPEVVARWAQSPG